MRWFSLLLLLAACAGDPKKGHKDKGPNAGDDDNNGDDDDNNGDDDDNNGDDDDNNGDDDDDVTINGPSAFISLFTTNVPITTTLYAVFYPNYISNTTNTTPFTNCSFTPIDTTTSGTITFETVSAGEVVISLDGEPVTTPAIEGWPAGQSLSVSATGSGEFPAFSVDDLLIFPDSPFPVYQTVVGAGIEVTWQPVSSPDAVSTVAVFWADGYLICPVDNGASSFTIPAEELIGTGGYTMYFSHAVNALVVDNGVNVLGTASISGIPVLP